MGGRYYLMRKNEVITVVQLNDEGKMTAFSHNMTDTAKDLAPMAYLSQPNKWIYQWWADRSIPITRDHIKDFLAKKGYTSSQYLVKNLGLSLTDYYWIKPVDSDLTWEKVNLYQNDFHDNILLPQVSQNDADDDVPRYSPNGSLQGNIEKTWTIINGDRCLIKGNHSALSRESLNEVIVCKIHEMQSYDNYTHYDLIHIKGKAYPFGCVSKAFTSLNKELVSAWAVYTSEKNHNNASIYEHFIHICGKHGIDKEQLRSDLEYQIMVDYIVTGYDRHLNNISILRDADSMQFLRMAPIYDSGDCLFANRPIPRNMHELQKMEISSFAKTETKLLKYVKNPNVLDLTKLPSAGYIRSIYEKDENISEAFINKVCEWYQKKIELCRSLQLNRDVNKKTLHP